MTLFPHGTRHKKAASVREAAFLLPWIYRPLHRGLFRIIFLGGGFRVAIYRPARRPRVGDFGGLPLVRDRTGASSFSPEPAKAASSPARVNCASLVLASPSSCYLPIARQRSLVSVRYSVPPRRLAKRIYSLGAHWQRRLQASARGGGPVAAFVTVGIAPMGASAHGRR